MQYPVSNPTPDARRQPAILPLTRPASGWKEINASSAVPLPKVLFKFGAE
jgi:hypothetical protein